MSNEVQIIKHYHGNPITFLSEDNLMINATEMAKPFGKQAVDWLKTQSSKEFIGEYSKLKNIGLADLVKVTRGGNKPGTWMHEDVALEFARWLSPKFAIWCEDCFEKVKTEIANDKINNDKNVLYTNSDIQIIKKATLFGKEVDVYGTIDNPLFKAKDVAEWIGYDTSSLNKFVSLVDDEEDKVRKNVPTPGGMQEVWMLTENGLYEILMQSRKPIAKQFKKGVKQILHEIRTKGGYMTVIPEETPEQTMARAILIAQATMKRQQKRIEEQQKAIKLKDTTISSQQKTIKDQKPAVTFTNAVSGSKSACLIGELAKLICQNGVKIRQNRLFEWLREHHYLGTTGERRNIPNQEYIEKGLFIVKKGVRTGNDGVLYTTKTTKVTGRGQVYFINKFLSGEFKINSNK